MARLHFIVIIEGVGIADDPQNDQTLASLVADGIAQNGAILPPASRWSVHRIRPEVVTPAPSSPASPAAIAAPALEPSMLGCGHCGADISGPPDLHVCKTTTHRKRRK